MICLTKALSRFTLDEKSKIIPVFKQAGYRKRINMKVIVVGSGKVGSQIIEKLVQEGHEVTAVDIKEKRLAEQEVRLDILSVHGNGVREEVLREAGAENADLLIAVTAGDEINLLCAIIAKKIGTTHTIARVRDPEIADQMQLLREETGLTVTLNPELMAAQEIFSVLRFPGVLSVEHFSHGRFTMADINLSKEGPLTQVPLKDLSGAHNVRALICAVQRNGETIIPDGEFRLEKGDVVSFAAEPMEAERFLKLAGIPERMPRDVMIIGAGKVTYYLLRMMEKTGMRAVVIESSESNCNRLSYRFPNALIICADGTDRDVLFEEGIAQADAFVSMTGTDEVNVLLSMYAESLKVPKIVTKVSREAVLDLVRDKEIGSVVSPRGITASRVIRYARAMENAAGSSMEELYWIAGNTAEALEFVINNEEDGLTDVALMDLPLKDNLLVCAIIHEGQVIIPSGKDRMQVGDRVVIVTTIRGMRQLKDILK